MSKPNPRETVELVRKLDKWAAASGVDGASALVMDLGDIHAAAAGVADAIDRLANGTPGTTELQAPLLVRMETLLYDELQDHMNAMREQLLQVTSDLYSRGQAFPGEDNVE
jgi:hypothetical protein